MSDFIKREDVVEALYEAIRTDFRSTFTDSMSLAIAMANNLPSAEPERKMGRWERHNTYHGDDVSGFIDPDWRCSKCGEQANVNAWCMYDLTDFCPNCGADMRGK